MPCDGSGMAEIHRMFKAGFGEAGQLVAGVAEGDTAHADVVAARLDGLSKGLHAHHEFEDEQLWEPLTQRAPACALHVGRMREQHAQMLVHLQQLDAALPTWRATARTEDARPIVEALGGINTALAVHLPDEEATVVPVMEQVFDQKEVDRASAHGRKATPKGQVWPTLGAILAAQPDGGQEWLRKHLPAPMRWAWRHVGRPRYEANRRALTGQNS